MQHGRLAVAAPGREKAGHIDCPAEGYRLKPAGGFAQGHNSDLHLHQALCTAFGLRGTVMQPSFADRNSGRGIAQSLTLDQLSREFDTVQPSFPREPGSGSCRFGRLGRSRVTRHH